jgi:hypothetical protein
MTHLLELFLYFCYAVGRIIWVCNVVFVDLQIAACGSQYQVDNLCDGFRLMRLEPRYPLCGDILEPLSAGEHVGCAR